MKWAQRMSLIDLIDKWKAKLPVMGQLQQKGDNKR
jgi:hypothetical protein